MRPWRRPSALGGSTSTSTWSPCMAPLISLGGMKISSIAEFAWSPAGFDWAAQSHSRRDADRAGRRRDCRALRRSAGSGAGNAPVLAIELDELAAGSEPGKLLEQQTPLAAAAQAEFADQLLVSGFSAGRGGDPREQFAIGHSSRLGQLRQMRAHSMRMHRQSRGPDTARWKFASRFCPYRPYWSIVTGDLRPAGYRRLSYVAQFVIE